MLYCISVREFCIQFALVPDVIHFLSSSYQKDMDIASVANDSKEPHLRQRYAFHCRFLKNEILISIDCNEIVTLY